MSDREWLRRFCDEYCMPALATPFALGAWDVATDGRSLIAVAGATRPAARQITPTAAADIAGWLLVGDGRPVDRAALETWAGVDEWPKPYTCGQCGHGGAMSVKRRPAPIGCSFIDRNRVAQALAYLPGDLSIVVTGEREMIHFIGDGWHTVIMPMTGDSDDMGTAFDGWLP